MFLLKATVIETSSLGKVSLSTVFLLNRYVPLSDPAPKNRARLIQKIYEVDPLTCPKWGEIMRILAFIEDREVIRAILKHLGLWLVKLPLAPKAHSPPAQNQHGSRPARNQDRSGQAIYVLDQFS